MDVDDGRVYHRYKQRLLQSQVELIAGMTNNLNVVDVVLVFKIVTMLPGRGPGGSLSAERWQ